MAFHIVLNRPSSLEQIHTEALEGLRPRHSMVELSQVLDAKIHDGTNIALTAMDRALGKVTRMNPLWWAIARSVRSEISVGDVIFCTGEDIGAPVALLCGAKASVAMTVHSADSLKKRIAFKLLRVNKKSAKFFAVADSQIKALHDMHGIHTKKTTFLWDQTDTRYFSPGAGRVSARPLIMSIGLERRDYTNLAKATSGLDVDVKITGFSADTRTSSQAFPTSLQANMTRAFYSWPDLLELYRSADIVVVSLFPNNYAAGVQGLMEAMSCGKPVIVTATEGLKPYLDQADAMCIVPPQDAISLRRAILDLLNNPHERQRLSDRGKALAAERYSLESYLSVLSQSLRALAA